MLNCCRWEKDIAIDITEIRWKNVVWILLAQDRDQWQARMNF
jgi:hypothetical protein